MITLTPEQSRELKTTECPVVVRDEHREYLLVPAEYREVIERLMHPVPVDRSLYECEDVPESK